MVMVVLIDNYDSFTYNLVQTLGGLDPSLEIRVFRNDQVTVEQIESLRPDHLIISPGPGTPRDGGISVEVVRNFAGKTPLLGVCLGHQCLAYAYGGQIVRAKRLVHGKTTRIRHSGEGIFAGLKNPFEATRYHSLIVPRDQVPQGYTVTAYSEDDPDEVMAMENADQRVFGVQFHPESFLTAEGPKLLANFLAIR
jgi:anthranilate synthase/phosphoribosyltransferase